MAQRCVKSVHSFEQMPQMKLKPSMRLNQMEFIGRKMNTIPAFAKMNKAEFQRMQVAVMAMMVSSSSNLILNLAEVLSSTLSTEEDEESSSSGVRRRRRQR